MDFSFGLGELTSSLVNNLFSRSQAKQQFEYDKQMAALQNQYNIDMWNMQNAYNTPAAQMQRLVQAGLSPNLAYGQVSSGNATSAPDQTAPRQVAPSQQLNMRFNVASNLLNLINMGEKIQQERIRTRKMLDDSRKSSWQERLLNLLFENRLAETAGKAALFGGEYIFGQGGIDDTGYPALEKYYSTYLDSNLKNIAQNIGTSKAREEYTKSQKLYQDMVNDWFKLDRIFNYSVRGLDTLFRGVGAFKNIFSNPSQLAADFGQYNAKRYYTIYNNY